MFGYVAAVYVANEFSGVPNQRGTPAVEHFDAAADVAAQLIQSQIRDSGRTATWWEVKNESDVKSEWLYHHEPTT